MAISDLTWDELGFFSDGLASYSQNGKFGYIDYLGKTIISNQYKFAGEFQRGAAVVSEDGEKFYLIDRNNHILSGPFDKINDDFEGKRSFLLGNKIGFIDSLGKIVCNPRFPSTYQSSLIFNEGIFIYIKKRRDKDEKYNSRSGSFKNTDYCDDVTYEFYDTTFNLIHSFDVNDYCYCDETEIVSSGGLTMIPYDFDQFKLVDFKGTSIVSKSLESYANYEGECFSPHTIYKTIFPYRSGDLHGYMKTNGQVLVSPEYFMAYSFQEDVAVILKEVHGFPMLNILNIAGNEILSEDLPICLMGSCDSHDQVPLEEYGWYINCCDSEEFYFRNGILKVELYSPSLKNTSKSESVLINTKGEIIHRIPKN